MDCDDNSDEPSGECSAPRCGANQFKCTNGRPPCIFDGWKCDGKQDCTDGSDENTKDAKCPIVAGVSDNDDTNNCPYGQAPCPGTKHQCIPWARFCDGVTECPQGTDEGNMCLRAEMCAVAQCPFRCYATPQGPRCICPVGALFNRTTNRCEGKNKLQF
jgi:hypothetical protein